MRMQKDRESMAAAVANGLRDYEAFLAGLWFPEGLIVRHRWKSRATYNLQHAVREQLLAECWGLA